MDEERRGPLSRSTFKVSEGLLIAAAPGFGYVLAFVYELGFANAMKIPVDFIRLDLRDILLATVVLGLVLLLLVIAIDFVFGYIKLPERFGTRALFSISVLWVAFVGPQAVIYRHHPMKVLPFALGMALPCALPFLFPLIRHRQLDGYWNRLEDFLRSAWGPTGRFHPPSRRLRDRYGPAPGILIVGLILLYVNTYLAGDASALDTSTYLVSSSTQEVVLRIYGDRVILVPYHGSHFSTAFRIADLTGAPSQRLEVRHVGPLRPSR